MKYRKLGDTDIDVSVICLGTMTWGRQNSEADAHEQLNYAMEQGVNFIDTAELYAVPASEESHRLTEQYIGTWLKDRADRDKIILATKVTGPSAGLKWISENLGFSKERMIDALHKSLDKLQTDYIDLYQLHWPERKSNMFGQRGYTHNADDPWEENFEAVLDTLNEFKKEGKIRHYGISNETPWGAMRWQAACDKKGYSRMVSVQNPFNLLNRLYEVGMAEVSIREKCGLLAYSPMGFGMLSGKYHRKEDKPEDRVNQFKNYTRYSSPACLEAISKYMAIAEKYNIPMAQFSLAFVSSRDFLTANIIGATTMDQLKENIASIDVEITPEILKEINAVQADLPNPAP